MKRFELAFTIAVVLSLFVFSFSGFAREWEELREEVVRLHILANSDDPEDQALKLAVRDAVLANTSGLFQQAQSKEQATRLTEEHLPEIEAIAQAEITRQGYDYSVTARLVNRFFDTRDYDDFSLPAGRYDAVQLEIGSGQGKNWWCVMFPPLCVPSASKATPLEGQIRTLGKKPRYKPAFAVVEAVETLQEKFAK